MIKNKNYATNAKLDICMSAPQLEPNETLNEMRSACEELESLLFRFCGLKLNPAPLRAWHKFSSLPSQNQVSIIRTILSQSQFIEQAISEEVDGEDEISILKFALGKLRLICDQGSLDLIQPGDIIEILDGECRQLYRSFTMFGLCNYSIAELTSYPWYELYERPSKISDALVAQIGSIAHGKEQFVSLLNLPEYIFRETVQQNPESYVMREKFMAAVSKSGSQERFILSVKTVQELPVDIQAAPIAFL